jgi:hypothetical protein
MARKIDVTTVMVDLNNEPITDGEGEPLTLRHVLTSALVTLERGERADGGEQFDRYMMARRIHGRDEIEFSAKEIVKLQERVAIFFAPVVTGQVRLILEGEDVRADDGGG